MTKDSILKMINQLSDSFDEKSLNTYKDIIEKNPLNTYDNIEEFYLGLIYPLNDFLEVLIKNKVHNSDNIVFIYTNYDFIKRMYLKPIEKKEGYICSHDKTYKIINSLINFFINAKYIEFDYNQEYTYNLPKSIFTSHDEILDFYEAIKNLYYGNCDGYIELSKKY